MLWKLAWRNLWRNKRRSMIVLSAVTIGMMLLILTESWMAGMLKQMLEDQIGSHVAHVQIHRKGFDDNKIVQNSITDPALVESIIKKSPSVVAYSKRIVTYGLASSASNSSGVSIIGVDPRSEEKVTKIRSWVANGQYLGTGEREIVLGRSLGERLGLELGDKVVLMASALDGQVGSDVFRVVGLYETSSSEFDKMFVYIPLRSAQRILAVGEGVSEFAIVATEIDSVSGLKEELERELGATYEVFTYKDQLPAMMAMLDIASETMGVYYVIIGAATIFGIINTLLMSVFERIREFGVLMAMGMNTRKVFSMILIEALLLGVIGTVVGMAVGLAVYLPLWKYGVDLSSFAAGLKMVGASAIVHPILTPEAVIRIILIIPFISVLAAIYPGVKAVRLVPVRAIHYV